MLWFLLLFNTLAFAKSSPLLSYKNGAAVYSIERSETELILRESPSVHRIKLNSCNKKLIDPFIAELNRKYLELQRSKQPKSYVQMGGVKRQLASIFPTQDSTRYFLRVPNIFIDLSLKDIQRCGK